MAGRPKSDNPINSPIKVYFTEGEKDAIEQRAEEEETTLSNWCRTGVVERLGKPTRKPRCTGGSDKTSTGQDS